MVCPAATILVGGSGSGVVSRALSRISTQGRRTLSSGPPREEYEAVVVGGGHNGLVAAAYLARLGVSTAVFERRHVLGGAAVTEEIIPGYKFSRASYVLSLLRPAIVRELELKKHGLKVHLRDPSSYTPIRPDLISENGPRSLVLGGCPEENKKQIAQFSAADALRYEEYERWLGQIVEGVDSLLDHAPVQPDDLINASLLGKVRWLRENWHLIPAGKTLAPVAASFYELMTAPTTKILEKWFESEPLKATLATDSCIGAMISPDTPGSGYVLLHHVMGELEGIRGAWGYPEGGMGGVSNAIAKSALAAGAELFASSPVASITTTAGGSASGIVLEDGTEVKASLVLSGTTPEVTFSQLLAGCGDVPSEYRRALAGIDYTSPVCKINIAVNKIPNFLADPNTTEQAVMPHHRATIHLNCENSEMLEQAYKDAKEEGTFSRRPMIEMTIPSSLDSTLAPPGHHVCLVFSQYAPYHLRNRTWDESTREEYANIVIDTIEEYAPGFRASIVGKEVLPPPELERIFGLTGGNIFHGSMSLDQLYMARPTPTLASPQTPIPGLLLCGSGAHPGGGVMGAPGRIAAKAAAGKILNKKWTFQ